MLRGALVFLSLILLLFVIPLYLTQSTELERLAQVQAQLEEEYARAEAEEADMVRLRAMANSPEFIERIARDELGLVRPNEIIFSQAD